MRMILFVLCYVVQVVLVEADDPPGHLQPIGSHMPPMHIEERNDFPNPIEFYDNYVAPGKPVLFKGAAKQFPSYNNWKNDTYLREKYGGLTVIAETAKKEDRNNPVKPMNFSTFLSTYKEEDIYLVQDVAPPRPITEEMFVPKSLLCRGFMDFLNMALLWFSSGGTKSVLHNDSFENINCLFDGTKELIMIDRKHKELVPIDHLERGYSFVDVERVDMYKYPTLSKLPWYIANMDTGDCLYIPRNWYHHVNSSLTRNLAINLWWLFRSELKHRDECEKSLADLPEFDCLNKFRIKSGVKVKHVIFEKVFEESNSTTSTNLLKSVIPLLSSDMTRDDRIQYLTKLKRYFTEADTNEDSLLTREEVEASSVEILLPFLKKGAEKELINEYQKDEL